jgi:hypothetical protein
MILVILAFFILLFFLSIGSSDGDIIGAVGFGLFASIVAMVILIINVRSLNVIDDKIAMYEEQNTKIEEQIAEVVQQYMEYESGVFTEVSSDSAITLVSLYPELKADALVASQVELYVENNKKITSLMEKKINGSLTRWWLYFGG